MSLALSAGTLAPAFDPDTLAYTAEVDSLIDSVSLVPTAADGDATIEVRVNGGSYVAVSSGASSGLLLLSYGGNPIDVRVTSMNGITVKTYTSVVTRQDPSNNADLSDLELSVGTLTPLFDSSVTSYAAAVDHVATTITVTATADDPGATLAVRVNGGSYVSVGSGIQSPALTASAVANPVDVRVTAEDGSDLVYTVVVNRSASANANLAALELSVGTLSPVFDGATVVYGASVLFASDSLTVTPTAADLSASLRVRVNGGTFVPVASGNASNLLALAVGDNVIDVEATAEDGTTIKTYTVTVSRAVAGNADLVGLAVSVGALSPVFDTEIESYDVAVTFDEPSIAVTATVDDVTSSLEVRVNGSAYAFITSGVASGLLALDPGSNLVNVRVTAADGVTQRVYTIAVTRILRVTTLIDEDDGIDVSCVSFREALEEPGAVIDFDPSLDDGIIVLTEGRITIEKSVLIDASSLPNGIKVSGNDITRVLRVLSGNAVTLNRVSIIGGMTDSSNGAGIKNEGNLTLVDLEISGNAAPAGGGGGINNQGTLTMERVAVVGNQSSRGGGLYNSGAEAMALVIDCTFAGNLSNRGGGVSQRGGDMKLINVTISSNTVPTMDGGGGVYMTAPVLFENTIVAGNSSNDEPDIRNNGGTVISAGTNLIGVNESVETEFPEGAFVGTVLSPVDPGLALVGDYGGLTRSMALSVGSLARDNGLVTAQTPTVDQRGVTRVLGSGLDIGAYEAGGPDPLYYAWIAEQLPTGSNLSVGEDYDGDGISNLREYGFQGDPAVATFDPQIGELVTNGSSGQDHLLVAFPHRLDAADLVFEVRAASGVSELADGGDHLVVYRFENGSMTESSGFVSRNDGVSPPVIEVMDTQSTTSNERRFLQLRTILK